MDGARGRCVQGTREAASRRGGAAGAGARAPTRWRLQQTKMINSCRILQHAATMYEFDAARAGSALSHPSRTGVPQNSIRRLVSSRNEKSLWGTSRASSPSPSGTGSTSAGVVTSAARRRGPARARGPGRGQQLAQRGVARAGVRPEGPLPGLALVQHRLPEGSGLGPGGRALLPGRPQRPGQLVVGLGQRVLGQPGAQCLAGLAESLRGSGGLPEEEPQRLRQHLLRLEVLRTHLGAAREAHAAALPEVLPAAAVGGRRRLHLAVVLAQRGVSADALQLRLALQ
mmetsp:Transcript_74294/g.197224  ORF Transcript_74294/g.197224 Transcript_74294/m.197224 type:complete len:285 (-) Transcript_74294:2077-2931(-)